MSREQLTFPISVAVALAVIVGLIAGLGDWSAPAIYGATALVGVVFVALLVREELRRPEGHGH